MEAVIRKWGNSLGIRIPSNIAKEASISDGSHVDIEDVNGEIIIRPKNKYILSDMLNKITNKNIQEVVDINGPVGNEIW
jgi:antitoxin MazE